MLRRLLLCVLVLAVAACDQMGPPKSLTILSGSENKTLEPIVMDFCKSERWDCHMKYLGSVDIMLALRRDDIDVDAVWPAHSRWIEMGDSKRRVKHDRSIMTSPVALGIRQNPAEELGLKGRPVTTAELVDLVEAGKLKFLMTSATQSNSGFSAYIVMLTALPDSPLGFVAHDQEDMAEREAFLLKLQDHLLSADVQKRILAEGRRTGLGGVAGGGDPRIFRAGWGIDAEAAPKVIRFPAAGVIETALALYRETLRKPSLLALCLDVSGSMEGAGEASLQEALGKLFDPAVARTYMIQPTRNDVFLVLPFNSTVTQTWVARGPEAAAGIPARVQRLSPGGGTNIYDCAETAITDMAGRPEAAPHIIGVNLMTDGKSQGEPAQFRTFYRGAGVDIPVYGITFGEAETAQLEGLATLTRARVFDGRHDLEKAFRHARGYN